MRWVFSSLVAVAVLFAGSMVEAATISWNKLGPIPVAVTVDLNHSEVKDISTGLRGVSKIVPDPIAAEVVKLASDLLAKIDRGAGVKVYKTVFPPHLAAVPAVVVPK